MRYADRACEICGSADHAEIFSWDRVAKTRLRDFKWSIRNVVCRNCGFAFVSPAPTQESLHEFYMSCFALFDGSEVGIPARLSFLKSLRPRFGSVVEIGGNRSEEFSASLRSFTDGYLNCEIAGDAAGDVQSLNSLADCSANLVVSYYVFEHVVGLPDMLAECRRVLSDDGVLVIEVPDIGYYPHMLDAIALHEHVNHFSVRSLRVLLAQSGFRMTALSREHASRKFGFVAAFEKGTEKIEADPSEVQDAAASLQAGRALMLEAAKREERLRKQIVDWAASGRRVVAWAANAASEAVIGGVEVAGHFTVVDSNPGKRNYLTGHLACLPGACASELKAADTLVIFSEIWAHAILKQVREIRRESGGDLEVIAASNSTPDGFVRVNFTR
jgi:SAM-dependent methyltransferase